MRLCRSFLTLALCISSAAAVLGQSHPGSEVLVASTSVPSAPSHVGEPQVATLPDGPSVDASSSTSFSPQPPAVEQIRGAAWKPLTGQQRLILFWNDTYNSPGAFLALSASALASQMTDTPPEWSRAGNGYTRRFASGYGQLAVRNIIHEGLAGVTGQDPRYLPCYCKGTLKRTGHALRMTFTTYNRNGHTTLDVPKIAGAYGSGMISTYWYPHRSYRPTVEGVQFGHEEMGEVFIGNLVDEFSADLRRTFHLGSGSRAAR
ncbi:MAG TPA: hypothetical protein VGM27_29105 [Acidobacteriaceae bacterium]